MKRQTRPADESNWHFAESTSENSESTRSIGVPKRRTAVMKRRNDMTKRRNEETPYRNDESNILSKIYLHILGSDLSSSVPEKLCICRPPLLFQRDQINSLRNGRDYDLQQIENAFRDPEDRFWGKNSSESSEVY